MRMKLRTLIVDDESPARDRLRSLLAGNDLVELIGEAADGAEAVERIDQSAPDLVLLDIQMPVLDGFEVLEALDGPPAIIFVTAYDEYAIRAFEVNALDYLLKPFSQQRLDNAISRAYQELAAGHEFAQKIKPLLQGFGEQKRYLRRLAVRAGDRFLVLDTSEIDWIEAKQGGVVLHVGAGEYTVNRTLVQLESRLDATRFFRAHRSLIVNLDRVEEIVPWFAGGHKLRLIDGTEVDLSRSRAKDLRELLGL
jgi:two-component system LytT family response regulator